MNTNKWLYFRTVTDTADDDGKNGSQANETTSLLVPASNLISMHPASDTVLTISLKAVKHLEESSGYKGAYRPSIDRVNLTIAANTHESIMESITEAITAPNGNGFINVADDCVTTSSGTKTAEYINSNINSVSGIYTYKTPQGNGMHEYYEIVQLSKTDAHTDADGDVAGSLKVKLPAQCILLEAAITSHQLSAKADASVRLDYHSAAIADGSSAAGTEWIGAGASGTTAPNGADLNIGSGDVLYDTIHSGATAAADRDTAETHFQLVACEDFTQDSATTTTGIVGVYIKWFGPAAQAIV